MEVIQACGWRLTTGCPPLCRREAVERWVMSEKIEGPFLEGLLQLVTSARRHLESHDLLLLRVLQPDRLKVPLWPIKTSWCSQVLLLRF